MLEKRSGTGQSRTAPSRYGLIQTVIPLPMPTELGAVRITFKEDYMRTRANWEEAVILQLTNVE